MLSRAGKCWLLGERNRRDALKARGSPKPAYERPASRSPEDSEGGAGSHVPFNTNAAGNNSSSAFDSSRQNGFGGRLAPTVSVGGLLIHETVGVPARGSRNRFLYDPENGSGSHDLGNGLRTGPGVGGGVGGAAAAGVELGGGKEEDGGGHGAGGVGAAGVGVTAGGADVPGEELLEHDYGDAGRTEVGAGVCWCVCKCETLLTALRRACIIFFL